MTDKMRASIAAAGRASADRRRTKETCTRGHPFDETNTIQTGRQRVCRACSRVRQREYRTQRRLAEAVRVALVPTRPTRPVPLPRPRWRQLGEACVSIEAHDQFALARWTALRAAMLAAHPDRGGTVRGFERALAAFRTFVKDEDAWYERVLLRPPWTQTRPGPARPDQAQLEAPGAAAPRGDPPRDAGVPARRRPGPSTS
jgi:hypothetical protein